MSDVVNAEVDFEIDGTKAKSIFITKNSISIGNIMQGGDSISSIKTKAYIYVAGIFLGVIPVIGWIFGLLGGLILLEEMIVGFSIAGGFIMSLDSRSGFSFGIIAFIVLGALICLIGLVFGYFYYRDLATVTNEKFFNIAELIAWIKFKEIKKKRLCKFAALLKANIFAFTSFIFIVLTIFRFAFCFFHKII